MRVAGIEIRGHPGLGDLDVDLRGADGRAAKLVVVAGENGCGKTALLEAIFAALAPSNLLLHGPRRLAQGRYRVLLETDAPNTSGAFNSVVVLPGAPEVFRDVRDRWPGFDGVVIDVDGRAVRSNAPYHRYYRLSDDAATIDNRDSVEVLGGAYSCFYSEANVSFEVPPIQTIGTSAGEGQDPTALPHAAFPVRGGAALAGEVAQLLVDLQAADDAEVGRWLDENEGRPPESIRKRRIKRFTEAFARIAPHKRFLGTETVDGEHRVTFEESGFRTALADLSTGEKQIVFRGAFLLRRADDLPGAVVLIDEPELSLHPNWQSSILPFYERIVAGAPGKTNQVVVATHSPFVVHGSPTAKHVVLRRDRRTGKVQADAEPAYPGITAAEVAVAAFDLGDFAREAGGKRLVLVVEGPTDRTILQAAWDKLRPGPHRPFVVLPAGGARGVQQLLGSSELGKTGPLLGALAGTGADRVVGLFDFDGEGYGQWNGTVKPPHAEESSEDTSRCACRKRRGAAVWAALLPVPPHRQGYAGLGPGFGSRSLLTTELLFPDEHVERLLSWVPAVGAPGARVLQAATDAQKRSVAEAVGELPPSAFAAFEPIFSLLDRVLRHRDPPCGAP